MEREYRNYGTIQRFDEESRIVSGYALKFNEESQYMGFYEKIDRSALTEDVLAKSDIFALLNHNSEKVLARSRKGEGSLHLELREDGLYYEFEAPRTQYGDELIEHLKRGEISGSSFCCSLPLKDYEVRSRDENGKLHRTIIKIERMYDVSPVFEPAYLATTCTKRTLEIIDEEKALLKQKEEEEEIKRAAEEEKKEEEKEEVKEEEKKEEEVKRDAEEEKKEEEKEEDVKEEKEEEKKEDEGNDDSDHSDDNDDNDDKEDKLERSEQQNIEQQNKNINHNIMDKNFSLLRAISDIVNGKQLDAVNAEVIKRGKNEMRTAGKSFDGQIQLPTISRDTVTVNIEGEDVVATDIWDIISPLRADNVLVQAGAQFYSGLIDNIKIPIMGKNNVFWEGETDPAKDGAGTFTHVELSPKRITAYYDVSKQFLIQTQNLQAEAKIRADIVKAISNKLEETILGDEAGTATQPAGIFYNQTPAAIETFKDITDLEAELDLANVIGDIKYLMDPKSKSVLRNMARSADNTRLVMENNEVDGTPALVTSSLGENKLIVGNFSSLVIGQWGALDITVDPYTQATNGMVRLVLNCFFDAKVAVPEALALGDTAEG